MRARVAAGAMRTRVAAGGLAALGLLLVLAPGLAPRPAGAQAGPPFRSPGPGLWLGTDHLGRDVWSQLLHASTRTVTVPAVATVVLVATAGVVGMSLGLARARWAGWALGALEVVIVLPPMVLVLVVVSAWGGGALGVVLAVLLSGFGMLTRVVASATRQVAQSAHVEAAVGRGVRTGSVIVGEVAPRVVRLLLAEGGLRMVAAVQLVAGLSFLGLATGLGGTWATAVRDARVGAGLNPWAMAAPCLALALVLVTAHLLVDLLREGRT